jgi:hypothetical protein
MASHFPVNHRTRGFWRTLAVLAGLYVVLLGIVGLTRTSGMDTFATHGRRVLGLTVNPGFSYLNIVVGAIIVIATIVGRNIDVPVNLVLSFVFNLAGMFSLAFLRTDLNFFAFSVTNCIVSFVVGTILFLASMYGRTRRNAPARLQQPGQPPAEEPLVPAGKLDDPTAR